jgi:uncharacterized protein (TIGR03435 family)
MAGKTSVGRNILVATIGVAVFSGLLLFALADEPLLRAQSPAPDWQTAAGGKMSFDVASIKHNQCGSPSPDCSLDTNVSRVPGDFYSPNGGLLRVTNWNFMPFIVFAYKLNANQYQSLTSQLPNWAKTERFDIQARATSSDPTKDQMRLMMQSRLADRFKLVVHTDRRQLPVFALVLDRPGKMGPQLRSHSDNPPCAAADSPTPLATIVGGYPVVCGINIGGFVSGHRHLSARNVNMDLVGSWLGSAGALSRPVLDQTGLKGNFDFTIEWTPDAPIKVNGENVQLDELGPTFLEALKEQLGLKLEPQTSPVDVLVIDHVEQPSEN